jgi:MFS family permease
MSIASAGSADFLSRARTVASPVFNRWLVPPAALAIHPCIGMAYGFSVFWLPLSRVVGGAQPKECAESLGFFATLVAADCDWKISWLGWTFTLFFVFLGSSAAIFGHWLETAGPRKAGLAAACCWRGDRRGLATGLAIMGFGGGAMIGAPLADRLMSFYATPNSPGVWQTFVTLAAIYFAFMVAGALGYRVPADGWKPEGFTLPAALGTAW